MAWRGYELTDPPMQGEQIALIKQRLWGKYEWARQWPGFEDSVNTAGDVYDSVTRDVVVEFQNRTGMIASGTATAGICNYATQVRLGSWPPPPPPRHAVLTFRGTGGLVGQDYTSIVAQECVVGEEVPMLYPASMGGIPVGTANDPMAPDGMECVNIAIELAADWFAANPTRTFILDGYSLGAIAASRVRAELEPGGRFERYKPNYVCGVTFGNPARAFGHTYFLGTAPNGEGISDWHLPESCLTWDWCDLAHPGDLYTNRPLGKPGEICEDAYGIVMNTQVSDPIGTIAAVIPHILEMVADAGITLPILGSVGNNHGATLNLGLVGMLLPLLSGALPALLGNSSQVTGPAAAVQAAILALRFFGSGTADHINYHVNEVWPGQTYLGLAIQHVNDWGSRVPVRM